MQHKCTCAIGEINRYKQRLSGPLLDRIDMTLEVARLPVEKLVRDEDGQSGHGESSAVIKARVMQACAAQYTRNMPVLREDVAAPQPEESDVETPPHPKGTTPLTHVGNQTSAAADDRQSELTDFTGDEEEVAASIECANNKTKLTSLPICANNVALTSRQVKAYCKLDDAGQALLTRAVERLGLSARAYECIRKVARTIATSKAKRT